jgi:phosphatidylglycerol:prolipoprotein diacylglycerol transferase
VKWKYVDVAGFVFPISLMVGRIGCALAHDHPGTVTRFPLAISLSSVEARAYITSKYAYAGRAAELPDALTLSQLGFHDLGWYEFLYLAAFVVPVIVRLRRDTDAGGGARPGTFVLTFLLLYLPGRFLFDFLRVSDVRYLALTPAQWTSALALLVLPVVFLATRDLRADART